MDFLGLNPVELHQYEQYEAAHPDAAVIAMVSTPDGGMIIGGQPIPLTKNNVEELWVGTAGALGGAGVTIFGMAVEGAEVGAFGGPIGVVVGGVLGGIAGTVIGIETWNTLNMSQSMSSMGDGTAGSSDIGSSSYFSASFDASGHRFDDYLANSGNTTGLSK